MTRDETPPSTASMASQVQAKVYRDGMRRNGCPLPGDVVTVGMWEMKQGERGSELELCEVGGMGVCSERKRRVGQSDGWMSESKTQDT
jgi:hypothetical protein